MDNYIEVKISLNFGENLEKEEGPKTGQNLNVNWLINMIPENQARRQLWHESTKKLQGRTS